MVSRIWAVCSVILNAVSLAQAQVQVSQVMSGDTAAMCVSSQSEGQNATICNVTVSLSSEWGLQVELQMKVPKDYAKFYNHKEGHSFSEWGFEVLK